MARSRSRSSVASAMRRVPVRPLVWAVVALLATGSVCLAARSVWLGLTHRPEFTVRTMALELQDCPEWVNGPELSRELRGDLRTVPRNQSVFDAGLAHAVARALGRSPWVLEVQAVKRRLPNGLEVSATFRRPAGLVRTGGRLYMVDADGHWLRDDLFRRPAEWDAEPPPHIIDNLLSTPPLPGERWDGPRLAAGARLCQSLRSSGALAQLQLAAVDVTGVGRAAVEPDIVLLTASGTRIKWGQSSVYAHVPGLEEPLWQTPDAEKLAMLKSKLADCPNLAGVRSLNLLFHGQMVLTETD